MKQQYTKLEKKHGIQDVCPINMLYCKKTCVLYWQGSVNPFHQNRTIIQEDIITITPHDFVLSFFEPNNM